jgi:hypothetical protein
MADDAYAKRIRQVLAGKPVIQVNDLWIELGLDKNHYTNTPVERYHFVRLLEAGYHPTFVSGVYVLVRGPWVLDAFAEAVDPKFAPYLEDNDPLMELLVCRAQRDLKRKEKQ